MESLNDVIAHNMSEMINEGIKDVERDGFMVFCHDGTMTIKSNIHPWRNNHKGHELQEKAIKNLQKRIGGEFVKDVFGASELKFDVSNITSARCNDNKSIFAFDDYITVITKENNGIIIPTGMLDLFKNEFPNLSFKENGEKWEFVEYTGGYPALCSGDTILKCGDIIIKTKIIHHGMGKWEVRIPAILKNIEIPLELLK